MYLRVCTVSVHATCCSCKHAKQANSQTHGCARSLSQHSFIVPALQLEGTAFQGESGKHFNAASHLPSSAGGQLQLPLHQFVPLLHNLGSEEHRPYGIRPAHHSSLRELLKTQRAQKPSQHGHPQHILLVQ